MMTQKYWIRTEKAIRFATEICEALGWDVNEKSHCFDDEVLYWLESNGGRIGKPFIQVNFNPDMRACVYAIPFGVCTGWHKINTQCSAKDEALRLEKYFNFENFCTESSMEKFSVSCPNMSGFTEVDLLKSIPSMVFDC